MFSGQFGAQNVWQIGQINKCISIWNNLMSNIVKIYYAEFGFEIEVCRHVQHLLSHCWSSASSTWKKTNKQKKNTIFKSCVLQQQPHTLASQWLTRVQNGGCEETSPGWINERKKKTRSVATSPAGEASVTTDKSRAPAPQAMEDTTTTVQLGSRSHRHQQNCYFTVEHHGGFVLLSCGASF